METAKIIDQSTGKEFEIPSEGSLGLLALGAVAVKPWRQRRIDTGFEKELRENVKKHVEEQKKKMEELKRRKEEENQKKKEEDGKENS